MKKFPLLPAITLLLASLCFAPAHAKKRITLKDLAPTQKELNRAVERHMRKAPPKVRTFNQRLKDAHERSKQRIRVSPIIKLKPKTIGIKVTIPTK